MVLDPNDNSVWWSGGKHYVSPDYFMCVSRSTDSGATWARSDLTTEYGYVNALAIDPSNTDIAYVCGYPAIYKTTDGGSTWNEMSPGLSSTAYCIVVDPVTTNVLYAGRYNGLYKSTDGGSNWVSTGCTTSGTYAILIDPDDHTIVYGGTRDGVYKSMDGGSTWVEMNDGLEDTYITSLDIYPNNYLFAGTNAGGMYRWDLNTGVADNETSDEESFVIYAVPNPFTGKTTINYQLDKETPINISIYDIGGRLVKELINETKRAGTHILAWHGLDNKGDEVASGVYFYKLTTEETTHIQKLILVR